MQNLADIFEKLTKDKITNNDLKINNIKILQQLKESLLKDIPIAVLIYQALQITSKSRKSKYSLAYMKKLLYLFISRIF